MSPPRITRAGAVCFNLAGQVLIIPSLNSSIRQALSNLNPYPADRIVWVLPKGHIEKGESPAQAARRELKEEAGVSGRILHPLGVTGYTDSVEGPIRIAWFAALAIRCDGIAERDVRWASPIYAVENLAFEDLRQLVRRACCWPEEGM